MRRKETHSARSKQTTPLLTSNNDTASTRPPKLGWFDQFIQNQIINVLLPSGGNWYVKNHSDLFQDGDDLRTVSNVFFQHHQHGVQTQYSGLFQHLDIAVQDIRLSNSHHEPTELELVSFRPQDDAPDKPGNQLHVVYFCGADTYYQECFSDLSVAVNTTGATYHAFNYPGVDGFPGQVHEFHDLVNSGIAVVNHLLRRGIHPDQLVLQGDSFGASVAYAVKRQFANQSDIALRIIANNTFSSFKKAILDSITSFRFIPKPSPETIKSLLQRTGWHVKLASHYRVSGPYQCFIQHDGDLTLQSAMLLSSILKYRAEMATQVTRSTKRPPQEDTCPEEYREQRDELDNLAVVQLSSTALTRLAQKYGKNRFGQVDAHLADLAECELIDGTSAYQGLVNKFLFFSNQYVQNHPQPEATNKRLPELLFFDIINH